MRPARILVVEDEFIVAKEIEMRVAAMGYHVVESTLNAEKALKLVERHLPDLVLMDIRLQGEMDGITAAEEIRRRFHLPVVFLTAYSEDSTLERAKLADPYGYIFKPFEERELKSAIEIALYKHRAEREILRLNRLYDVLSQVSQAIVRAESRDELLKRICRIMVERGAINLAWIGWLDPETARIHPVAHWGRREELLSQAVFYADGRPEEQGNPGRAILEAKPVFCNECIGGKCLYPAEFAPAHFGFNSCGSFPIRFKDRICGVLNLGIDEGGFFQEREIELLEEVSHDISFALDKLDGDARRVMAEDSLRKSEERYRLLVDTSNEGVWAMDSNHATTYVNRAMAEMLGYEPSEMIGRKVEEYFYPEDEPFHKERMKQRHAGVDEVYERRFRRRDGSALWTLVSAKAIEDARGRFQGSFAMLTDITERKRAEDLVRERERYLRAIFQATPHGFWVLDGAGRLTEVNAAYCLMSGYTREELLSMKIGDLDAAEQPHETASRIQRIRERGFEIFETRHQRKDGTWFDIEVSTAFLDAAGGQYVCFGRDITETKQDKLALKEEAVRRRTLMDQSMDGIVILDQNGKVFETNCAFADMLGYSMEEMASLYVWDWDLLMSRSELEEAVRRVDASGEHFTTRHRRKDGSSYHVEITSTAATWEGRKFIMCVCRDISERIEVEEALRESEKRLQRAEKVAHFGHWEFLLRTKQVRVSDGARTLYGLGEGEWSIDAVQQIPLGEYRTLLDEALRGLIQEGKGYSVEFKIRRPSDGKIVDIHSIAEYSPERGAVFGVIQDITRRKRAEEEREMLELQLRQAQKLEAIGTLAGGIAHDFNNILAPIIGYTEMAMDDAPPFTPVREYMEQVLSAAHRAKDLIKQILAFSRQGQEERHAPIDISPIAKEALKLMRASLPTGIEIRQDIQHGIALADATQIHQVIVNLCANAAQAMGDKGTLDVSLAPVDLPAPDLPAELSPDLRQGSYLRLRVRDTGPGMDSHAIGRIFDPYFTTKEVGKGSGLGLAVAHGIIKKHKGAICVRSEPGRGSTFDVYIPRIESAGKPETASKSNIPVGAERILLVDDEPMVAELGAAILSRLGYQVTMKNNPSDALAAFRSNPYDFDLIVTDYAMPYMTGTELSAEILRLRPDMRIILCTGYSERATEEAVSEMGIRGFAMKPLDRRQLAELVRRALDA